MLMHNNNFYNQIMWLLNIKYCKMLFLQKQPQAVDPFHDITEGSVRVLSMADNGDSG